MWNFQKDIKTITATEFDQTDVIQIQQAYDSTAQVQWEQKEVMNKIPLKLMQQATSVIKNSRCFE